MNHSLYLTFATLLIKADLRREERIWKRYVRRNHCQVPWNNTHLLKDIGLEANGYSMGYSEPDNVKMTRRIRHLRRALSARIST
ncbi:DUF1127 domain-containing protein [Vibrio ostreicida]|uniref:DUF1127 domain-containing protein n=1 Tax=Vibrio ostreicida TaxID=526588 RepID=UPI003B5B7A00